MNRIILIGNGFDKAHGLLTGYDDFINWYWNKRVSELKTELSNATSDILCTLEINSEHFKTWSLYFFYHGHELKALTGEEIIKGFSEVKTHFRVTKSYFFSRILHSYHEKGWVDIENEYYRLLFPSAVNGPSPYNDKPSELNEQLEYVRSLLIEYLNTIQKEKINESIVKQSIKEKFYSCFKPNDISISAMPKWNEFVRGRCRFDSNIRFYDESDWDELLDAYDVKDKDYIKTENKQFINSYREQVGNKGIESIVKNDFPKHFLLPDRIMLLNFNYSNTADLYLRKDERFVVNHIHGNLNEPDSVIFGYGDELDENYKIMSEKNDNEYLRNIKSVKYLESPNYRNLLEFIESSSYQILIMGHSCGNSDRTLLNTLFEHRNCVSIKPFYHVFDEGKDNYMDLVQNISRNFTDMKLMRDRVVNKTFCETI